jgi:hypothetical protein
MLKVKLAIVSLALMMLSGCATMFNSGSQSFMVRAADDSEGVKVQITTPAGSYVGKLPATVTAKPNTFHEVSIKVIDKCYQNNTVVVSKGIAASYWVNILNGSGFIIDPLVGTMWDYDDMTSVPLTKKDC